MAYQCSFSDCDRVFQTHHALKIHLSKSHNITQTVCTICQKKCRDQRDLLRHLASCKPLPAELQNVEITSIQKLVRSSKSSPTYFFNTKSTNTTTNNIVNNNNNIIKQQQYTNIYNSLEPCTSEWMKETWRKVAERFAELDLDTDEKSMATSFAHHGDITKRMKIVDDSRKKILWKDTNQEYNDEHLKQFAGILSTTICQYSNTPEDLALVLKNKLAEQRKLSNSPEDIDMNIIQLQQIERNCKKFCNELIKLLPGTTHRIKPQLDIFEDFEFIFSLLIEQYKTVFEYAIDSPQWFSYVVIQRLKNDGYEWQIHEQDVIHIRRSSDAADDFRILSISNLTTRIQSSFALNPEIKKILVNKKQKCVINWCRQLLNVAQNAEYDAAILYEMKKCQLV